MSQPALLTRSQAPNAQMKWRAPAFALDPSPMFERGNGPSQPSSWSASAGQALEELKKTADSLLREQQSSHSNNFVSAQDVAQAKQEIARLQQQVTSEQRKCADLLADNKRSGKQMMEAICKANRVQRLHEHLQLDMAQLTASLHQSENQCKEASSAVQACQSNFDRHVQAFDALTHSAQQKVEGLRKQTQDAIAACNQQCEDQARCAAEKHQEAEKAYNLHLQQLHGEHGLYKQEAQERTAGLISQGHALQMRIGDLEAKLATAQIASKEDAAALAQAQMQASSLQANTQNLGSQLQAVQHELEAKAHNLAALKDSSLHQISSLEDQLATKHQAFNDLEMAHAAQTEMMNAQQQSLEESARALSTKDCALAKSERCAAQATARLQESMEALALADDRLESQAARTQLEYAKLKARHDEELKDAKLQASESSKALAHAKQQLVEARTNADQSLADWQSKLQQQQQDSTSQMQHAAKQLELQRAEMQKQEASLMEQIDELHSEKLASNKLVADSNAENNLLELQVAEADKLAKQQEAAHKARLMADHTAAAERYAALHADLQAVKAACDCKMDELEGHLSSMHKDLAEAGLRQEELEDELEAQQQKLETAQNELSQKTMLLQQISQHAAQPVAQAHPVHASPLGSPTAVGRQSMHPAVAAAVTPSRFQRVLYSSAAPSPVKDSYAFPQDMHGEASCDIVQSVNECQPAPTQKAASQQPSSTKTHNVQVIRQQRNRRQGNLSHHAAAKAVNHATKSGHTRKRSRFSSMSANNSGQSPDLAAEENNSMPSHPAASNQPAPRQTGVRRGNKQNSRKVQNPTTDTTHYAATIGEMFGMLVDQQAA